MDILEKLPALPDDALNNLRANAERLGQTGSPAQRTSASALLPAIEAELSARRAAKRERAVQTLRGGAPKRRVSRKKT